MPCPGAHLCDGSAPHVPESGTTGAFYPLFRSPRPINRDVRRTCDLPRAPEAKKPNFGAGVRFFDTPETAKPFYRVLRGTSPVSGVRPRCAPASKMEETAPGVQPHIAPRPSGDLFYGAAAWKSGRICVHLWRLAECRLRGADAVRPRPEAKAEMIPSDLIGIMPA